MRRLAILALVLAACGGGRRPAPFPFPTYQPPAETPEPAPVVEEAPTPTPPSHTVDCQLPPEGAKRCNAHRTCDCWRTIEVGCSYRWRTCDPKTGEPLPEETAAPPPPPLAPSPVPPTPAPCVPTPHHPCPTQATRSSSSCVVTTTIDELRGEQLQHACGPGIQAVSITGDRARIVYALTYAADWEGRAFAQTEAHKQASEAARTSCSILLALYPARVCAYQVRDGAGHPVCATEIAEDGSGSTICVSVVGEGKAL